MRTGRDLLDRRLVKLTRVTLEVLGPNLLNTSLDGLANILGVGSLLDLLVVDVADPVHVDVELRSNHVGSQSDDVLAGHDIRVILGCALEEIREVEGGESGKSRKMEERKGLGD